MKTRSFTIDEKIQIIFSDSVGSSGIIGGIISIVFSLIIFFASEPIVKIALYNSTSYVDGTDSKVEKIKTKNGYSYDHSITYMVDGKSYEIIIRESVENPIQGKVKVKYLEKDPKISTTNEPSMFGIIALVVLASFFAVLGFVFLFFGIKDASQKLAILENGEVALGKFLRSESTSVKELNILYFSFKDKYGKKYETTVVTKDMHKLQDEVLEMLVYMPDNIEKAVFLDTLHPVVRKKLKPEFLKLKNKKS